MVQRPKAEVRDRFLEAARQRFAADGFGKTSLRAVVAAAGGSLGNLRNYFATKDALFAAACEPVCSDVQTALDGWSPPDTPLEPTALARIDAEVVAFVADYITRHRHPLMLLLSKSEGSALAGWSESVFAAYVELELRKVEAIAAQKPSWLVKKPSRSMVVALCRMHFDLAAEFVRGTLDLTSFHQALHEYDAFREAGLSIYVAATR